jgi:hypothetical protein
MDFRRSSQGEPLSSRVEHAMLPEKLVGRSRMFASLWQKSPLVFMLALLCLPFILRFVFITALGFALGLAINVGIGLAVLCVIWVAVQKLILRR